jgi:hypothetical protein
MERRDYLMRQIELLGQALANALARLLNLKQPVPGGLSLDEIKQVYSDELDLSLDLLLETPKEDLVEVLTARVKFIDHHLEKMAGILTETADLYESSGDPETAVNLFEKSIRIYEHLQETSGSYSLERIMHIRDLQLRIQSLP